MLIWSHRPIIINWVCTDSQTRGIMTPAIWTVCPLWTQWIPTYLLLTCNNLKCICRLTILPFHLLPSITIPTKTSIVINIHPITSLRPIKTTIDSFLPTAGGRCLSQRGPSCLEAWDLLRHPHFITLVTLVCPCTMMFVPCQRVTMIFSRSNLKIKLIWFQAVRSVRRWTLFRDSLASSNLSWMSYKGSCGILKRNLQKKNKKERDRGLGLDSTEIVDLDVLIGRSNIENGTAVSVPF